MRARCVATPRCLEMIFLGSASPNEKKRAALECDLAQQLDFHSENLPRPFFQPSNVKRFSVDIGFREFELS